MNPHDAALTIAARKGMSVEEIEEIILAVIQDITATRKCCGFEAQRERAFWNKLCRSEAYWLAMTSQYCNSTHDPMGAARWIAAAAAVENLIERRKRAVYAAR